MPALIPTIPLFAVEYLHITTAQKDIALYGSLHSAISAHEAIDQDPDLIASRVFKADFDARRIEKQSQSDRWTHDDSPTFILCDLKSSKLVYVPIAFKG